MGSVHMTDPAPNSELIPHSLFFDTPDSFQPSISNFLSSVPTFLGSSATPHSPYSQPDQFICSLRSTLCFCMFVVLVYNFLQLEYSLVFLNACCIQVYRILIKVQLVPLPGSFPCLLPSSFLSLNCHRTVYLLWCKNFVFTDYPLVLLGDQLLRQRVLPCYCLCLNAQHSILYIST